MTVVNDILALIKGPDTPGDQWRWIRPLTRLGQLGVKTRWEWHADAILPTSPDSTVLIARLMSGSSEARIDEWLNERRSKVRAIVYEFDDVMWGESVVDHLSRSAVMAEKEKDGLRSGGEMARYFASQCDGVIVSSAPLAAMMRPHTDRPVIVVPNAIDIRWFRCQMAYRSPWAGQITIGWCGGRRPEADVLPMARAWNRIAKRYPEVRFTIASSLVPDAFYQEMEDIDRIVRLPWQEWDNYPLLYQVDIGCCSVENTEFSRAKTPIKAWEYALGGAAVVATPTLYGECVSWGGLLAETDDEWEDRLSLLVENERLRHSLRDDLIRHVERRHALDANVCRWPEALGQIVAHKEGQEYAAQERVQPQVGRFEYQDRDEARQGAEAGGRHRAERRAQGQAPGAEEVA